ncbi:MAG TPA: hotdog fold domain-containing protein [Candidatus Hydrogenedens sp.]|nr:hypothetical protein [Candidatus Hydrogenedens sp.]HOK08542.1 hotdog fold domain-containing protein [Candidatus Hydrogenedens sp.]HOL19030.1 hotdog fold domain-containing protein [Candidatus Hydrogenedens sp.]HPP57788.1 hotdog fold domain-containing protein [Candidatus Hydrogenedens sp.]
MDNLTEQFFSSFSQYNLESNEIFLKWPSPTFTELKMSVAGVQVGKSIVFILPVNPKFQDNLGFFHPGYISEALNEAFYCFAYSVAKRPCIPIHTEFSLINPVPANSPALTIEISVSGKSRKVLFLSGKVYNYREKVHAIASAMITPYSPPSTQNVE